jgi:hypothetical protein
MEQRPHNPDDDRDRGVPELERLDVAEIDLTGVVRQDDALADVIGDAILEAESHSGVLPEWGARTLARALANERGDPLSGALHHFAVTGRADPDAMARELADLHKRAIDEELQERANWLATYVPHVSDAAGESSDAPINPRVAAGLREHGDAFQAFLRLPDVQQDDDNLLGSFQDFYIGSYASMRELLNQLTETKKGMAAIANVARDWGLEEFVTLDERALVHAVHATWDIVKFRGHLHVFMK